MAKVKYVDVTKCDGCRGCMAACKNWNDLPVEREAFNGTIQSHKNVTANTWNVVTFKEVETTKNNAGVDWLFRHASCMHCNEAACEKVCSEKALTKTIYNSIDLDEEKCVGCGYCVSNCPFNVIGLKTIERNGKEERVAGKCTLCIDRIENNKEPACATACHTGSIRFADKETILAEAEERLGKIKERYPNANIYNPESVGGTNTIYLLADKPSVYGLPENPKVPMPAKLWKDYIQPGGKLIFGAAAMTVIGATISNALLGNDGQHHPHETDKGGKNIEE